MLNELYRAARALRQAGIHMESQHESYVPIPKSPTFKVKLAKDGSVAGVAGMTRGEAGLVCKFAGLG